MAEILESNLLDAKIIYNEKTFHLTNTEMDIKLCWKLECSNKSGYVQIKPVCEKLYGKSTLIVSKTNTIKKTTYIEFETDSTWVFEIIKGDSGSFDIFPDNGVVDFDKKHVTIGF